MQRRQFLRDALSLGAAGLILPSIGLASSSLIPESDILNTKEQSGFGVKKPQGDVLFLVEVLRSHGQNEKEPLDDQRGNASLRRQLFNNIATKIMKIRRKDVFVCNVECYRQPKNRKLHMQEIMQCHFFVNRMLEDVQPKFICCFGSIAAKSLFGRDQTLQSFRGEIHNYNEIPVVCTYHPMYFLGRSYAKEVKADVQLLREIMER